MQTDTRILLGASEQTKVYQLTSQSNRHGLIAGATGTGKTITLQILAEGFSRAGVAVFAADIKGDLSGLGLIGKSHPKVSERIKKIGIEQFDFQPSSVVFWDLFAKTGHPVRTTISEMGPLLLANLLELNESQMGVIYACFKIADDEGMLLLDLKDIRSMLVWMAENAKQLRSEYGNISTASIGAIQRRLLVLEEQGAKKFFGEPALQLQDLMQIDEDGYGKINLLEATKLSSQSPRLYATFLLWLMSELFEELPEVGNPDKPKIVFFFDEAHLLFKGAPKALIEKIEQVVRLIRSKGVGIYFITQSPMDIPDGILGQLGLKIQHALRAFTPKDKKAVRLVAETFRANSRFETKDVITELGTGEALVSVLDEQGRPTPVERTLIRPPESMIGPMNNKMRKQTILMSDLSDKYNESIDRESAYEILKIKAENKANEDKEASEEQAKEKESRSSKKRPSSRRQSAGEAFFKSTLRSIGSSLGRRLVRGILGSLLGK